MGFVIYVDARADEAQREALEGSSQGGSEEMR